MWENLSIVAIQFLTKEHFKKLTLKENIKLKNIKFMVIFNSHSLVFSYLLTYLSK